MGKPRRYNSKQLTEHLRTLAAVAHDWSEQDGVITKGEALAKLLWQKALGYTESTLDDEGKAKEVTHKPEAWAIQLIYDRMEGRSPQAIPDDEDRNRKVLDNVRELALSRLNDAAKAAVVESAPPTHTKKDRGDNAQ